MSLFQFSHSKYWRIFNLITVGRTLQHTINSHFLQTTYSYKCHIFVVSFPDSNGIGVRNENNLICKVLQFNTDHIAWCNCLKNLYLFQQKHCSVFQLQVSRECKSICHIWKTLLNSLRLTSCHMYLIDNTTWTCHFEGATDSQKVRIGTGMSYSQLQFASLCYCCIAAN